VTVCDRGEGGVKCGPKKCDIFEWPHWDAKTPKIHKKKKKQKRTNKRQSLRRPV